MAKKISKNSRAARQAEASGPEVKTLSDLPRPEKTDLSNILIRTTAKNEALLEAKIKKPRKKVDKKNSKERALENLTHLDKNRVEKALNFSSRLDGKIKKSTSRAKYVQNIRKAGWDTTNELIRKDLAALQEEDKRLKVQQEGEGENEGEDDPDAMKDEPSEEENEIEAEDGAQEESKKHEKRVNMFDMLPVDNEA